jgi:hypothetical protein
MTPSEELAAIDRVMRAILADAHDADWLTVLRALEHYRQRLLAMSCDEPLLTPAPGDEPAPLVPPTLKPDRIH